MLRPRTLKRKTPTVGDWPASKLALWFFTGLAGVALLLSGIFVQTKANDVTHDQRLVDTIIELESAVSDYYDDQDQLPDELAELSDDGGNESLVAKAAKFNVEYNTKDQRNYELCADFRTDKSGDAAAGQDQLSITSQSTSSSVRSHDSGRECFDYSVGSSFFRPQNNDSLDDSAEQFESLFNNQTSLN